ncbi:MAG: hypothetical protein EB054_02980 [Actinobacteria bacterium]|nr:hypothetical protein [Actinomycetota bacterium]
MAAKKKAAKRPAKKAAAKRPAKKAVARKSPAKKSGTKSAKKSAKRPVKKAAAKRPTVKKVSAATKVDAAKIQIPPVPSRSNSPVATSSAPVKSPAVSTPSAPAKKSSPTPLILVVLGIVVLAFFALSNKSSDDVATTPSASQSPSASASATPSESASSATLSAHEAPQSFVAINNANGGVTLRWKAPTAVEGLTGYSISVSYNAVDFTEVTTVAADSLSFAIAKASDEGGTQFLLQSVYSDGTKVDAKKFSLKGKYQN